MYEQGTVEQAQAEKERLEEKQRSSRRLKEAGGEEHLPSFFKKVVDEDLQQEIWTHNGTYWPRREKSDWHGLPSLY